MLLGKTFRQKFNLYQKIIIKSCTIVLTAFTPLSLIKTNLRARSYNVTAIGNPDCSWFPAAGAFSVRAPFFWG